MKKIIVPTDFSIEAEHALRFACELNAKLKAEIVLHHSYVLPVYATDLPVLLPSDEELYNTSKEALDALKSKLLRDYPDMRFSSLATGGFAEDEIPAAAEAEGAGLIIMGTKGASGIKEALIGTIAAAVMDKAPCPVMAVPEEASWRNLDRIVYATGYEEGDFTNAENLINLAKTLGAEVILLHVTSGKNDRSFEFDAIERFKERLVEETKYDRISFKLLDDRDVYHGVTNYVEEVRADMLAMTIRHRSLISKLFERSTTKRMAYHTRIPLIAYQGAH